MHNQWSVYTVYDTGWSSKIFFFRKFRKMNGILLIDQNDQKCYLHAKTSAG